MEQDSLERQNIDTSCLYDQDYYQNYGTTEESRSYQRSPVWNTLFDRIAQRIVNDLAPATALDVGCAIGILVEALRQRGVDAVGFDISDYAISQIPDALAPYIQHASILDPHAFDGRCDVVICIEVVEHLQPEEAELAIDNLCRWSDQIVFASSPEDFDTPSHFNVQPVGYWAALFARRGYFHVLDYDLSYIAPWAMLLRKQTPLWSSVIYSYENQLWLRRKEASGLRQINTTLRNEHASVVRSHEQALTGVQRHRDELAEELASLEVGYLSQLLALQQRWEAQQNATHMAQVTIQQLEQQHAVAIHEIQCAAAHDFEAEIRERLNTALQQLSEERAKLDDHSRGLAEALRQLALERAWGESVRSTVTWRLVQRWWRFRQWLIPAGTAREHAYYLMRTASELLLRHGPGALANRTIRWLRGERRYNASLARAKTSSTPISRQENGISFTAAAGSAVEAHLRIVYITTGLEIASKRYRVYNVQEQLSAAGSSLAYLSETEALPQQQYILDHDVIVFARVTWSAVTQTIYEAARQKKIPVCFEVDDYIFDTAMLPYIDATRQLPPQELQQYIEGIQGYREMLLRCDYFIGSTAYLAAQAQVLNRKTFVIRNGLSQRQVELANEVLRSIHPDTNDGRVRVGYFSGSPTHQKDFEIAAPAIGRILEEFSHVRLLVRGFLDIPPSLKRLHNQIEVAPFVHWEQLLVETAKLDVNLAPLEANNPFTQAKSALKYFEAAILEVPTIATPIEDFRYAIQHGWNGFLAADDQAWYDALRQLVTDADRRRQIGRAARQHVLSNYTPATMSKHTLAVFQTIVADQQLQ